MKSISERHLYIKEQLYKNGFVTVQDLADQLEVTGATIRRDLRIMEGENLLRRNHGGASLIHDKVIELSLHDRSAINPEAKARIAVVAADLLRENDSMGVTSGSTVEAFVRQIQSKGPMKVVTPSIKLGVLLSEKMDVDLRILGGRIVPESMSTRDEYAIQRRRWALGIHGFRCGARKRWQGYEAAFPPSQCTPSPRHNTREYAFCKHRRGCFFVKSKSSLPYRRANPFRRIFLRCIPNPCNSRT